MVMWRCTGAFLGSDEILNPLRGMGGGIKKLLSCCASVVVLSFVAAITLIVQYWGKISKEWVLKKLYQSLDLSKTMAASCS